MKSNTPLKVSLLLSFFIYSTITTAQPPTLVWAKNIDGNRGGQANVVAADQSGNVYTTGYFSGTVDFDPGPGVFNLTTPGTIQNTFVSKLDASGNLAWAKSFVSDGTGGSYSIAVDASGNVYTSGSFRGTIDLDPGPGVYNFTTVPSTSGGAFISKLNSAGNIVWAKCIFGPNVYGYLNIDAAGNVYSTGSYSGTVDFDPGPGTFSLTSVGSYDIYIYKLDASGNFVWANGIGSTLDDVGRSIAVDISGNVYTTGVYQATADFDPGPGISNFTSAGSNDVYLSKLDASGNFLWAKSIGRELNEFCPSLALDNTGNVYLTGYFFGTLDFDPGPGITILTSAGNNDIFVLKLNPSGDLTWAKNMGGPGIDDGRSVSVDAQGNVYTVGFFDGTSDFDPGASIYARTSAGSIDIFVSKLNSSGNFVWAVSVGGSGFDPGFALALDPAMNVYAAGAFAGTADFDPGPGIVNLTATGPSSIFVLKLTPAAVLPVTLSNLKAYQKNSGVQIDWTVEQENNIDRYEVERSKEGQQFIRLGNVPATNRSVVTNYNLFDPAPASGVNFYRLKIIDRSGQETYSQVIRINLSVADKNSVVVYPNPVAGKKITLQMNLQKGSYLLSLTNILGENIITKIIDHAGGSATESLEVSEGIAAGTYQLTISGEGIKISTLVIKN